MNDNTIIANYLLVLKSNVEVFVHGTLESSYSDIQETLKKCLDDTIESQRDTFKQLLDLGVYTIEDIEKTKINKTLKKINNN